MKKLTAAVVSGDCDTLTRTLARLSCVEICRSEPAVEPVNGSVPAQPAGTELVDAQRELSRLESVLKRITPYRTDKPGLFPPFEKLTYDELGAPGERYSKALEAAGEAETQFRRLSDLKSEEAKLATAIKTLEPWRGYDSPLWLDNTRQTHLCYGTFPATAALDAVTGSMSAEIESFYMEVVNSDDSAQYVIVVYHNDDDADMPSLLSRHGFVRLELAGYNGYASDEITRLEGELDAVKKQYDETCEALASLSAFIPEFRWACDICRSAAARAEAKQKAAYTASSVILTGWVPVKACDDVSAALDKLDCGYSIDEPEEGDEPPTLLLNKKIVTPFETVVGLYSLPAYGTFDPTFIMSIFYFVIFGFMLGDFVYGLLLTVGGFLAIKFLNLSPGMKRLISLFAVCGISCMTVGVLFGSYLGDFPKVFAENMLGIELASPAIWFDPVSDPITFLIVSLVIGFVHLCVGMGIKFYVLWTTGHPFAAIFDVGSWYVVYAGIGVYFLNSTAGIIVALTGVAMLICSQGRAEKNPIMKLLKGVMSLYDFIGFFSDLLSYSRIMALGMASAVIASVINICSTLMGPSVLGYIMMLVILVAGNLVNLAINLLGSFVHTSRLQYIEFFGKFYEDGGRPFTPLAPELEYSTLS